MKKSTKVRKHIKKHKKAYKHKSPCRYFQMGNCSRGNACTFSHHIQRGLKTTLCKYYLVNNCKKGSSCLLSHDTSLFPCKYYFISGTCQKMGLCEFSHERFKNKTIRDTFIESNLEAIYQHYRKGVATPLNLHVVEEGHLEEKLRRNSKLNQDVDKIKSILNEPGKLHEDHEQMVEQARHNNETSLNILNALIEDGLPRPNRESSGESENDQNPSESERHSERAESEAEDVAANFDPF